MKSKQWAERFKNEDVELVKSEFALETRQLIDVRTKNSLAQEKGKLKATLVPATEGAVREQRQKWNAVCNKTNHISPADFDSLLANHLNDVHTLLNTSNVNVAVAGVSQG